MTACRWCQSDFAPSARGGHRKLFCDRRCRAAFHRAARRYTQGLIDGGFLSPAMLRAWEVGLAAYTTTDRSKG